MPGTPWDIPAQELEAAPQSGQKPDAASPAPARQRARRPARRPAQEAPAQQPAPEPAPAPVPTPPPVPAGATGSDDARRSCAAQALEALRLGVVPAHHLQVYTVGREAALGAIREDPARASRSGGLRVVLGDYGSGKTHLLELAQKAALGAGFLATKAQLDGRAKQRHGHASRGPIGRAERFRALCARRCVGLAGGRRRGGGSSAARRGRVLAHEAHDRAQ
ncbi:MAG: DUF2791 family P-loop domain-containing protein, partial [Deltaproteobacteria bacterium]|nr:DUF2791 family P-loop domain-containing protein [Deltaproteobacteria bacterium]